MAHHVTHSAYARLGERLNKCPQGAPSSDLLYRILGMLFSEEEAALVAQLPIRPFTVADAAQRWKTDEASAHRSLDALASRALLVDLAADDGGQVYVLPPPMAGFFEFSLMRVRGDVDQKVLSELYYQYINVEEEFIIDLMGTGETQLGRVFAHEDAIPRDPVLQVLDHERASEVVRSASHRGISLCYCRHKMEHVGRGCEKPQEICMTFNSSAESLVKHGFARPVDEKEGLDLLEQARELGLVQFGENVQRRVNFICNCCGCCCEALIAARKFGLLMPVHTSNYVASLSTEHCTGCGKCVKACPVEAMTLVSANDPHHPKLNRAKLDEKLCLGCGVCVRACPERGIALEERPERVITPLDSVERTVHMAVERGKLQHLLFDNEALWSHRALAAILGAVLRMPPFRQALANRQLKSRFVDGLMRVTGQRQTRVQAPGQIT